MAKIRVNIYDKAYVPSLGRGPFMDKVIHEELFRSLKRLGYTVEEVEQNTSNRLVLETEETPKEEVPTTEEEEATVDSDEEVLEDSEEETEQEDSEEEETEQEVEDETVAEPEDKENKVEFSEQEIKFLTGKAKRGDIIRILTNKGVKIENDEATISELLDLVNLKRR